MFSIEAMEIIVQSENNERGSFPSNFLVTGAEIEENTFEVQRGGIRRRVQADKSLLLV